MNSVRRVHGFFFSLSLFFLTWSDFWLRVSPFLAGKLFKAHKVSPRGRRSIPSVSAVCLFLVFPAKNSRFARAGGAAGYIIGRSAGAGEAGHLVLS